jgi:hypothetical protein
VSPLRSVISLAGALLAAQLLPGSRLAMAATSVIASGEYTMMVGEAGKNLTSRVCYHDKDVEILPALILSLEDIRLRPNCTVQILEQDERSARWTMRCQSRFVKRRTTGSIHWTNTSFRGQTLRSMGNIRQEISFTATRRGTC